MVCIIVPFDFISTFNRLINFCCCFITVCCWHCICFDACHIYGWTQFSTHKTYTLTHTHAHAAQHTQSHVKQFNSVLLLSFYFVHFLKNFIQNKKHEHAIRCVFEVYSNNLVVFFLYDLNLFDLKFIDDTQKQMRKKEKKQ